MLHRPRRPSWVQAGVTRPNEYMEQVHDVCRGLAPGEMPDIPEFLRRVHPPVEGQLKTPLPNLGQRVDADADEKNAA
jgi:hypothetical protein